MSRADAAKELWRDWKGSAARWWRAKAAGGPADQTAMWIAAVGTAAALIGLAMCPRVTVLACAGCYVWAKVEERRKKP